MNTTKILRDALKEAMGVCQAFSTQSITAKLAAERAEAAIAATEGMEAAPVGAVPDLSDDDGVPYMIVFDDTERKPELLIGRQRADIRFAQISASWNAHLYAKIASNSRDCKYPNAALAERGTVGEPVAWRWKLGEEEITPNMLHNDWRVSSIPLAPYRDRIIEPLCRCHPAPAGDVGLLVQASRVTQLDLWTDIHELVAAAEDCMLEPPRTGAKKRRAEAFQELESLTGKLFAYIDAQRSHAAPQVAEQVVAGGLTDAQIETRFQERGGKWGGNRWVIEDADLHPFARSLMVGMEFVEAIANHHTSVDNCESLHCNGCGADLDDREEHKPDCIVLRARAIIATKEPA